MSQKIRSIQIKVARTERVDALFDTGADANYIREDLAQRIKAPRMKEVKSILADTSSSKGILTEFDIIIRGAIFPVFGIIQKNMKEQMIVGYPFMQQTKTILNFNTEKITFSKSILKRTRKIYRL